MNTNTTPPTASELLAEWKHDRHCASLPDIDQKVREVFESGMRHKAAQLDKMCEDAGIYQRDGFAQFRNVDGQTIVGKHGPISLSELIAILEWLLIRDK